MTDKAEKGITELTGLHRAKDPALANLLRMSDRYEAIDKQIQVVLSPRIQGHVEVACVRDTELVLAVDSSAWVSRARLESQEILKAARKAWDQPLASVKVVVAPVFTKD